MHRRACDAPDGRELSRHTALRVAGASTSWRVHRDDEPRGLPRDVLKDEPIALMVSDGLELLHEVVLGVGTIVLGRLVGRLGRSVVIRSEIGPICQPIVTEQLHWVLRPL